VFEWPTVKFAYIKIWCIFLSRIVWSKEMLYYQCSSTLL